MTSCEARMARDVPMLAAAEAPIHYGAFCIGDVSVRIASESYQDVVLDSSLSPFRCEGGRADIEIDVEWADSLSPTRGDKIFDSGAIWRLYADAAGFRCDFTAPIFQGRPYKRLFVDRSFRRALLQMNKSCFAGKSFAFSPLEYPLDELLITHRLALDGAVELHSCGIALDGIANLFVGHSGAGKSTTSRLWVSQAGVQILSDDRIILREHGGEVFLYGTPWHGESAFALPLRTPLTRILVIEHGHGNVLTRLSPADAVSELFARSFVPFYRHEYVDAALEFLQKVAAAVPCYRYAFEPNESSVQAILKLRD
jgi:hypothetical protein